MIVVSVSPEDTRTWGERLGRKMGPGDLVALTGGLGAGKTVFVQGLAAGMGIGGIVTSPTYLIVKEYRAPIPLYHMDVYRLADGEELAGLGYEEYFYGRGVTVIEWADRVRDLLPPEYLEVAIQPAGEDDETRILYFTARGGRYRKLLEELKQDAGSSH